MIYTKSIAVYSC